MTAIDLSAIAARMESIGRNCEFGAVQQQMGADPTSLLRWAGTPKASLIEGLRDRFEGLAEEMTGTAVPSCNAPADQHWWLTCKRYGVLFHTHEVVAERTVEQATSAVRKRLRWLAAKLIEDIRADEKLFVFADKTASEPGEAWDLLAAMRSLGGRACLWSVAENPTLAGETMPMGDGLIGSWLPHLTEMSGAIDYQFEPWRDAAVRAFDIWKRQWRLISASRDLLFPPRHGRQHALAERTYPLAVMPAPNDLNHQSTGSGRRRDQDIAVLGCVENSIRHAVSPAVASR
jgi:hypothetical protein